MEYKGHDFRFYIVKRDKKTVPWGSFKIDLEKGDFYPTFDEAVMNYVQLSEEERKEHEIITVHIPPAQKG